MWSFGETPRHQKGTSVLTRPKGAVQAKWPTKFAPGRGAATFLKSVEELA
jgi:hypothetical protein